MALKPCHGHNSIDSSLRAAPRLETTWTDQNRWLPAFAIIRTLTFDVADTLAAVGLHRDLHEVAVAPREIDLGHALERHPASAAALVLVVQLHFLVPLNLSYFPVGQVRT